MLKPEAWGKLLQFLDRHHASPCLPGELAAAVDALAASARDVDEAEDEAPAESAVRARTAVPAQSEVRRLR
jgi:hypothetical protein